MFLSSFSWLNILFKMFIFICFEPFLLIVKIQNQFLTAVEKQPIVFSKQPIVLSLTAP